MLSYDASAILNNKHKRLVEKLFRDPPPTDIKTHDIESLVKKLAGVVSEGSGSRIAMKLRGRKLVIHRPHNPPVLDPGAIKDFRKFLTDCGVWNDA